MEGTESDLGVTLVGRVGLVGADGTIDLPLNAQRLLAYVSIRKRGVDRNVLAAVLWPEKTDSMARNNLRTSLWRLDGPDRSLFDSDDGIIKLAPSIPVDLDLLRRQSLDALQSQEVGEELGMQPALLRELGEGIGDDWIAIARERWRQLRLHVLVLYVKSLIAKGLDHEARELTNRAVLGAPRYESLLALSTAGAAQFSSGDQYRSRSSRMLQPHRSDHLVGTASRSHRKELLG